MATVSMLEELLVLPVALVMVMGAKQRRWRSNEVRCGNTGLRWASSSAKVSAVCLSSWQNQSGVKLPLPQRGRRGGLAMVVLSAMVSVSMQVRSYSDVQHHGWGPPFG